MPERKLNNILFTNLNGSGDDVLVYTALDAATLQSAYANAPKKITFDECYAIKDEEVQFYIQPMLVGREESGIAEHEYVVKA